MAYKMPTKPQKPPVVARSADMITCDLEMGQALISAIPAIKNGMVREIEADMQREEIPFEERNVQRELRLQKTTFSRIKGVITAHRTAGWHDLEIAASKRNVIHAEDCVKTLKKGTPVIDLLELILRVAKQSGMSVEAE